jgi:hypothetical protein
LRFCFAGSKLLRKGLSSTGGSILLRRVVYSIYSIYTLQANYLRLMVLVVEAGSLNLLRLDQLPRRVGTLSFLVSGSVYYLAGNLKSVT